MVPGPCEDTSFPGPKSSDIYWMRKVSQDFATIIYIFLLKKLSDLLWNFAAQEKHFNGLRREQLTLKNLCRITKMFLVFTISGADPE